MKLGEEVVLVVVEVGAEAEVIIVVVAAVATAELEAGAAVGVVALLLAEAGATAGIAVLVLVLVLIGHEVTVVQVAEAVAMNNQDPNIGKIMNHSHRQKTTNQKKVILETSQRQEKKGR